MNHATAHILSHVIYIIIKFEQSYRIQPSVTTIFLHLEGVLFGGARLLRGLGGSSSTFRARVDRLSVRSVPVSLPSLLICMRRQRGFCIMNSLVKHNSMISFCNLPIESRRFGQRASGMYVFSLTRKDKSSWAQRFFSPAPSLQHSSSPRASFYP